MDFVRAFWHIPERPHSTLALPITSWESNKHRWLLYYKIAFIQKFDFHFFISSLRRCILQYTPAFFLWHVHNILINSWEIPKIQSIGVNSSKKSWKVFFTVLQPLEINFTLSNTSVDIFPLPQSILRFFSFGPGFNVETTTRVFRTSSNRANLGHKSVIMFRWIFVKQNRLHHYR